MRFDLHCTSQIPSPRGTSLRLALLLCLFAPSACSSGAKKAPDAVASTVEKPAPLKAEVTQAFFVGDALHVSVQVFAKTELDAGRVLVKLVGLKQGEVAETDQKRGSEVLLAEREGTEGAKETGLEAGDSLLFRLSVPAQDLTEYQLQVSWGNESHAADEKLAANRTKAGDQKRAADEQRASLTGSSPAAVEAVPPDTAPRPGEVLAISGNDLEEQEVACDKPPCDKRYAIRVELKNVSPAEISGIRLAVGIYFSVGGKVGSQRKNFEPQAEGEDVVDLRVLRLQPGERKKLRIAVDRSVPVVPGGAFLPYVRILEFKPS